MPDRNLPISWNDLQTRFEDDPDKVRTNFGYFEEDLASARVVPADFGQPLDMMTNIAVQVALFAPQNLAAYLMPIEAPAQAILSSRKRALDELHVPRFAALAACNLAALAGEGWGQIPLQKPLAKLAALPQREEKDTRQIVYAHLAWGRTEGLEPLLPGQDLDTPPDPAADFEFTQQGLQVHLVRALRNGVGIDAVARSWASYLGVFPRLYATNMSNYSELLMATRAVHVEIAGGDPSDTLDWLRTGIE
jgi:hypothetical protein